MVYGVSAPESAPPPSPPGLAATEVGAAQDPWAAAAQPAAQPTQQQTQQQQQQPEDPWALDALGKGKGKGKGKLDCWNCLGEGHPSFLCPSGKGAGKAGSGPTCGNCRGKGHDATACPFKGGGKHTPKGGKGAGGGGRLTSSEARAAKAAAARASARGTARAARSQSLTMQVGRMSAQPQSGIGPMALSGQQMRPHTSGPLQPPSGQLHPQRQQRPHHPGWQRLSSPPGHLRARLRGLRPAALQPQAASEA